MYNSAIVGTIVVLVGLGTLPASEAPASSEQSDDPQWFCAPHHDSELGWGHQDYSYGEDDPLLNASPPDPQHFSGHVRDGCSDHHQMEGGGGGPN